MVEGNRFQLRTGRSSVKGRNVVEGNRVWLWAGTLSAKEPGSVADRSIDSGGRNMVSEGNLVRLRTGRSSV